MDIAYQTAAIGLTLPSFGPQRLGAAPGTVRQWGHPAVNAALTS